MEQCRFIADLLCDLTLGITHRMYYRRDGRTFEDRPSSDLEKCYAKAIKLVKNIKTELENELEEDYAFKEIFDKLK